MKDPESEITIKDEEDFLACGLEDSFGLYEIVWYFNGKYPEDPVSRNYLLAEEMLKAALDKDFVKIYTEDFCTKEGAKSVLKEVDKEESLKILLNPMTWYPDMGESKRYSYLTTDLGEQRHHYLARRVYEEE